VQVKLPFNVEEEAFAFNNTWHWEEEERSTLTVIVEVSIRPLIEALTSIVPWPFNVIVARIATDNLINSITADAYGLCGGMVFAALDYYRAKLVIPKGNQLNDHPSRSTPEGRVLREYIWRRLLDSLRDNVMKFIGWKLTLKMIPELFDGGAPQLLRWSREEWGNLKRTLDSGHPCPLFLIGELWNPLQDHQVLAYGYEESTDRRSHKIFVYDPNCPGGEDIIQLDFTGSMDNKLQSPDSCTYKNGLDPDRALRGFFCGQYSWVSPPLAVGLSSGLSASSNRVRGGDNVEFRFGAKHFGFHNSASVCLAIEDKLLPDGMSVDLAEEPSPQPISERVERRLSRSFSIPVNYPIGRHRYSVAGRILNLPTLTAKRTKIIPVKEPGTQTEIEIDVLPPAGGNWTDFGSFIKRIGDIWITPASKVAIINNADGRLEVFVVGGDGRGGGNELYHKWQTAPNGGWVTDWESLDGIVLGNPSVGQNADGRLEVFVRGNDNRVYHKWQTAPNGGWVTDWESLDGIVLGNPSVGQNADGRLEVFIRANDDGIYHKWQTAPNGGWERNFLPFSFERSFNKDPVIGRNADGRLEVFGGNEGGQLYHIWQTSTGRW
jgi:hypothetical protein